MQWKFKNKAKDYQLLDVFEPSLKSKSSFTANLIFENSELLGSAFRTKY